eukprot:366204-Chlamydomonas_euryale.AAC.3
MGWWCQRGGPWVGGAREGAHGLVVPERGPRGWWCQRAGPGMAVPERRSGNGGAREGRSHVGQQQVIMGPWSVKGGKMGNPTADAILCCFAVAAPRCSPSPPPPVEVGGKESI